MPDPFDPYREALVVEELTLWTAEARAAIEGWGPDRRTRLERSVQSQPAAAAHLEYVRVHTGFCRQITVQPSDVERLDDRSAANPEDPPTDVQ